jgi:hypothetical protein
MQSSITDPYQSEDHRHFHSYRENAQDGADRSVGKIGEDQFVEQALIIKTRMFQMIRRDG